MAVSVIIVLYVAIGLMSAAGSVFISKKLFSAKGEQIFFALFLILIAGFYLAFTAYFGDEGAQRFETGGLMAYGSGLVSVRVPSALIIGASCMVPGTCSMRTCHGGGDLFGAERVLSSIWHTASFVQHTIGT